jgi:hypothetical protein
MYSICTSGCTLPMLIDCTSSFARAPRSWLYLKWQANDNCATREQQAAADLEPKIPSEKFTSDFTNVTGILTNGGQTQITKLLAPMGQLQQENGIPCTMRSFGSLYSRSNGFYRNHSHGYFQASTIPTTFQLCSQYLKVA